MRPATQIRCDEYESNAGRVRVTSRKDHMISTDLKISRKFDGKILRFPERDAVFDAHRPAFTEMEYAHIDKEISQTSHCNLTFCTSENFEKNHTWMLLHPLHMKCQNVSMPER